VSTHSIPEPPRARSTKRIGVRLALGLATLIAFDQAIQYAALGDGELGSRRIAPFDPPIFSAQQKSSFKRIHAHATTGEPPASSFDFDSDLGWCPRPESDDGRYRFDWAGNRVGVEPLARERSDGVKRAIAIGCSYTLGMAVEGNECWVSRLDARRADLEIANLGVGAYGIDQALLRWRRDGKTLAGDEVWLGLLPDALPRIVTVYPPALRHWSFSVAFKPRFRVGDGGELTLVASPAKTLADLDRLVGSQADFIAAVGESDRWIASSRLAYSPAGSSVAHRSSIARLALTAWERRGREPAGLLEDSTGELFRLTRAIVRTLHVEVEASGARLRVFLLPDENDLADRTRRGRPYWDELVRAIEADGIEVCDVTRALVDAGGESNGSLWAGEGHWSAAGNALVADELERQLGASR
jgi:hypothetical protein